MTVFKCWMEPKPSSNLKPPVNSIQKKTPINILKSNVSFSVEQSTCFVSSRRVLA